MVFPRFSSVSTVGPSWAGVVAIEAIKAGYRKLSRKLKTWLGLPENAGACPHIKQWDELTDYGLCSTAVNSRGL
jgi:hypothetical protein